MLVPIFQESTLKPHPDLKIKISNLIYTLGKFHDLIISELHFVNLLGLVFKIY